MEPSIGNPQELIKVWGSKTIKHKGKAKLIKSNLDKKDLLIMELTEPIFKIESQIFSKAKSFSFVAIEVWMTMKSFQNC